MGDSAYEGGYAPDDCDFIFSVIVV